MATHRTSDEFHHYAKVFSIKQINSQTNDILLMLANNGDILVLITNGIDYEKKIQSKKY